MTLQQGAQTIIDQCLAVEPDETVAVVNDGNDEQLINALVSILQDCGITYTTVTYPEPETSGTEPPAPVTAAMKSVDVFIAPTRKSISHTQARQDACTAGARGATLPGITKEIWTTSLLADYHEVSQLCEAVHAMMRDTDTARLTTPSGTDLTLHINDLLLDTGIIHDPGMFGNLPAGEVFGAPAATTGTLVIDQFPYAPQDTRVEIEENKVVAVEHPGAEESRLAAAFDEVTGARNIAEIGIGTNPAATLIGNILQDEKVLGTVHIAFGDNASMLPEDDPARVVSDLHWDTVCESPTLLVDGTPVIEDGTPCFG